MGSSVQKWLCRGKDGNWQNLSLIMIEKKISFLLFQGLESIVVKCAHYSFIRGSHCPFINGLHVCLSLMHVFPGVLVDLISLIKSGFFRFLVFSYWLCRGPSEKEQPNVIIYLS